MRVLSLIPKKRGTLGLVLLIGIGLVLVGVGSRGQPYSQPEPDVSQGAAGDLGLTGLGFKVAGSVILVIGVLYFAMYAIRRFSPRLKARSIRKDAITVLDKKAIAPKKAIYIIGIGKRAMIVGVTDTQITHLVDLSEEELESLKVTDADKADSSFRQELFNLSMGGSNR